MRTFTTFLLGLLLASIGSAQTTKPAGGTGTGDIDGVTAVAPVTGGGASGTVSIGVDTAVLATQADLLALRDTTTKGYVYAPISAGDSNIVFEVRRSGCTIREIRAIRTGGTSASINAKKNSSDLLTSNYATTTSMASAGTLQNNTLAVGDLVYVTVRGIVGTVTEIFIQFTIEEPQR